VCFYNLQEEYEQLSSKIQNAAQKSIPCQLMGEFAVFSQTQARNHPTIIKVTLTFIERNRNLFGSEIRISNINDFVHIFSIEKNDIPLLPLALLKSLKFSGCTMYTDVM
jgi:hypothetical protein